MDGADVFVGLSAGNVLPPEYVKLMAPNPIIFALANPDPEIAYDLAMATRADLIMATGRSDHPNQVNNVLGFPLYFPGSFGCAGHRNKRSHETGCRKSISRTWPKNPFRKL